MKNFKEYSLLFFLLLAIVSIVFYEFIFGDLVFIAGDALSGQSVKHIMQKEYSNWFPYIFSGMPTVHTFLSIQHLYLPHHLMMLLFDLGVSWIWNFLFHYIFAGIGMYALLKYLKQPKIVSFFGGFLFMILPSMIAYMAHGHGSQIMTACYIPWIILLLFKNYNNPSLKNVGIFSLLIGFQLLRGHVQIAYYTWMMIGLFILIKLIEYVYLIIKDKEPYLILVKTKLYIFVSLFIGICISLSLYLPVKSFAELSTRANVSDGGGYSAEIATDGYSLKLQESLTFIFPYINGFGGYSYILNDNHGMNGTDFPNYLGLLIILLAFIGLWKSDINKIYKIFFSLSGIFSFLISLGKYFLPFYSIFFNYFPFFDTFRVPVYILIVFQFSTIVLAACGLGKIPTLLKNYKIASLIFLCINIIIILFTSNIVSPPKSLSKLVYNNTENIDDNRLEIIDKIKYRLESIYNDSDYYTFSYIKLIK